MQEITTTVTTVKAADVAEIVRARSTRSAWERGVKAQALDMLQDVDELSADICEARRVLINDAAAWSAYSWGGCALIYDEDIAARYCTPSELRKTRGGELRPNLHEEWLDVQARACQQAYSMINDAIMEARRG